MPDNLFIHDGELATLGLDIGREIGENANIGDTAIFEPNNQYIDKVGEKNAFETIKNSNVKFYDSKVMDNAFVLIDIGDGDNNIPYCIIKDKNIMMEDSAFEMFSIYGYFIASPTISLSTKDYGNLGFLLPIYYGFEKLEVDNNDSAKYSITCSFDDLAQFYNHFARNDFCIDYDNQSIVYYGIKANDYIHYNSITIQYSTTKDAVLSTVNIVASYINL